MTGFSYPKLSPMNFLSFPGLFLFLLFLVTPASENSQYNSSILFDDIHIYPDYSEFRASEQITAVFENIYVGRIYLVKRSSISPILRLQKYDGNKWSNANTARRGIVGNQAISYRELRFGESIDTTFPTQILIENDEEITGFYRYRLSYSLTRNSSDWRTVYSREFRIVE